VDHLPLFLDVKDKKVLVTGGGTVAARKAEMALRAGARVTVIADALGDDFRDLEGHERFTHQTGDFCAADMEGCVVAYGASEDRAKDSQFNKLAKEAGVLVNVADAPKLCDFIMPSIVDRSPLVIGISTSGNSPILARILKARLETMLPAAYGRLTSFVGGLRGEVMQRLKDGKSRRRFWERVLEGPVADRLLAGDDKGARAVLEQELDRAEAEARGPMMGEVFLVGAGPGDPDLLTFRALRLMQRADVVLYDRLIGKDILNLVRRDAERIYVGKMPKEHTVPQEEISQLLVRHARTGRRVLRLKGGDPFVFGRGGEEIEVLAAEGIPFQVVPGITAASGCAAYAGIPLTHRDHAQACVFLTGHGQNGITDFDWKALLQPNQTIAIYMGLAAIGELTEEFIKRGADRALPAAVIDNGTRTNQKVVTGTLGDLAERAATAGLEGPAIIVIGTVVTLRDKLDWFGKEYAPEPLAEPAKEQVAS
jgi:uroporphyrin-III C-methyltransferase/precorrin-2 dehydrogenase/sirohydrochlorin ferrochelatase